MSPTEKYLTALFRPGEEVVYSRRAFAQRSMSLEAALKIQPPLNFVAVNPIKGHKQDSNVTAHRNFLIEFDKVPLERQMKLLVGHEVPYNTLTFSGGKSYHAVISLTESVTDVLYAEIFELIEAVFFDPRRNEQLIDTAVRAPSNYTRVAGAERDGVIQELVDIQRAVSLDELMSWFAIYQDKIDRWMEAKQEMLARAQRELEERQKSGLTGLDLVADQTLAWLEGRAQTKGSRHNRLIAAACELADCGVSYEEALPYIERAADIHGITSDPARANEAENVTTYAYYRRHSR